MRDLDALRALLHSEPEIRAGPDEYCVLVADPDDFDEWKDCPPRRGQPFAQDGSEHEFCLLENGTVLLYTPLSEVPYLVVGANLREFLGLLLHGNGAQVGGLAYDWNETVAELAVGSVDEDDELTPAEQAVVARLTGIFELSRWTCLPERLRELEALLTVS